MKIRPLYALRGRAKELYQLGKELYEAISEKKKLLAGGLGLTGLCLALYFGCGRPKEDNGYLDAQICAYPLEGNTVHFEDCSEVEGAEISCRWWDVDGDGQADFTNCPEKQQSAVKSYQQVSGADNGYVAFDYRYPEPGTYNARLVVEDTRNRVDQDEETVQIGSTVEPPPGNTVEPPPGNTVEPPGGDTTPLNPPEVYFDQTVFEVYRGEIYTVRPQVSGTVEEYGWENVTEDSDLWETMENPTECSPTGEPGKACTPTSWSKNYQTEGTKLKVYFPWVPGKDYGEYKFRFWASNSAGSDEGHVRFKIKNRLPYLWNFNTNREWCEVTIDGKSYICNGPITVYRSSYPANVNINITCTPLDNDCLRKIDILDGKFNSVNEDFVHPCEDVWGVTEIGIWRNYDLVGVISGDTLINSCDRERRNCQFNFNVEVNKGEFIFFWPVDSDGEKGEYCLIEFR